MSNEDKSKSKSSPILVTTTPTDSDTNYDNVFEGIHNFRDVGVTINDFLGKRVIREGYLFRSGRLDEATDTDKTSFRNDYGIKVILDLRTNTERAVRYNRHPDTYENNITSPQLAEPIPGVETHRIYIIGRSMEKALASMLGWWSLFKVVIFMLLGFRIYAIKIISKEVIQNIGLVGMGTMALEYSGEEIKKMFTILTSTQNSPYPVLAHCTIGKDRTGLVILLILLCLMEESPSTFSSTTNPDSKDLTLSSISHDYKLTQSALYRIREEMIQEIVNDAGLPPSFVNVDPDFVQSVVRFIDERYGGVKGYLGSIGLDGESVVGRLKEVLLV